MHWIYFITLLVLYRSHSAHCDVINFVLVGATGDLARKYLWESVFIQFIELKDDYDINVYAAATRPYDNAWAIIEPTLSGLQCKDTWSSDSCTADKKRFTESLKYVQLRNEDHYKGLHEMLSQFPESMRIFYLSISPSLYENIAATINRVARPKDAALRVVFEKPFGKDLMSAVTLSELLSAHLREDEILRVDHYLGKSGMQALLDFRRINYDLLLSLGFPSAEIPVSGRDSSGLTTVSVVMAEQEQTAGRTMYYDQFGVVRDVMQNHLTQAVVYTLMHLQSGSPNSSGFGDLTDRLDVLRRLKYSRQFHNGCIPVHERESTGSLWLGQYSTYLTHLKEDIMDGIRRGLIPPSRNEDITSITPTAARVEFILRDKIKEEQGIKVLVSAGKALSEREMFVEVQAQHGCGVKYGVQGGIHKHYPGNRSTDRGPYILLEGACWENLGSDEVRLPYGWEADPEACVLPFQTTSFDKEDDKVNHSVSNAQDSCPGPSVSKTCILRPSEYYAKDTEIKSNSTTYRYNAYVDIIGALLKEDRSYFVTTEELHAQWALWDGVLSDSLCTSIELYDVGWGGLYYG